MYDKEQVKTLIKESLKTRFGLDIKDASDFNFYMVCAGITHRELNKKHDAFVTECLKREQKKVYYLSMEFLLGRCLKNNLFNLNLMQPFAEALKDFGIDIEDVFSVEHDAGLGNGGLGRLATCFMDALATGNYYATGYCIFYEYGIFTQKIQNGEQIELPDNWLDTASAWLERKDDQAIKVNFKGNTQEIWELDYHSVKVENSETILAVPVDLRIPGYNSEGVNTLRLWCAESPGIDMDLFNKGEYLIAVKRQAMAQTLSKILYPNDNHIEGKKLRLRQQYFMVAASVGDIVKRHLNKYLTLDNFADKISIHVNDTHPTMAILELMRIFLDDCDKNWDSSWDIVCKTFSYTNHTVMSEALEKWDESLFAQELPRLYQIVCEINRRFYEQMINEYKLSYEQISNMSIILNGKIKMANLCVIASYSVNGVSRLHSEIIKQDVFNEFYKVFPSKFTNVTNGIASRRWLAQSNPELTDLIKELIGTKFLEDLNELKNLEKYKDDKAVLKKLAKVKLSNKQKFIKQFKKYNSNIDPNSIFDVQVKRIHEYKRQHLNALNIIADYLYLKNNHNAIIQPKTYIFGGKAAPGYYLAKKIIKLICAISEEIKKDIRISKMLQVMFLENYNVSTTETLMPASEISEQISLAGTEASGTGNMKFMLNGAITLGTLDGANVEIHEAVGDDNIMLFGLRTEEVNALKYNYNPIDIYNSNNTVKEVIDFLRAGINNTLFDDVANSLVYNDQYMVLKDFDSYRYAQQELNKIYQDKTSWFSKSLINIANSGIFAADRAIKDYSDRIWHLPTL